MSTISRSSWWPRTARNKPQVIKQKTQELPDILIDFCSKETARVLYDLQNIRNKNDWEIELVRFIEIAEEVRCRIAEIWCDTSQIDTAIQTARRLVLKN